MAKTLPRQHRFYFAYGDGAAVQEFFVRFGNGIRDLRSGLSLMTTI